MFAAIVLLILVWKGNGWIYHSAFMEEKGLQADEIRPKEEKTKEKLEKDYFMITFVSVDYVQANRWSRYLKILKQAKSIRFTEKCILNF